MHSLISVFCSSVRSSGPAALTQRSFLVLASALPSRRAVCSISSVSSFSQVSLALLLVSASACTTGGSNTKDAENAAKAAKEAAVETVHLPDDNFNKDGLTEVKLDLNSDGKIDAYQYVRKVGVDETVVRKEADLNFDNKIDIVRNLGDNGQLLSEFLDTDFDGKVDLVNMFTEGHISEKQQDTNFDGKPDLWRYFDVKTDGLVRKEADLNYNGQIDYWEYFENGVLSRVGIDRDNDGAVDEWLNAATTEG